MNAADTIAENALIALLAVNRWTLDKAFSIRTGLLEGGLADFDALLGETVEEIAARLATAGYSRGDFMNRQMAQRILSMANVLTSTEIQRLRPLIQAGKREDVNVTLQKIEGVGPTVLESFWILQDAN
jgi:hypothetical protein